MPTPLRNAWRRPRNLPLAKLAPGYVADVSDVPFRTSIAPSVGSAPTLTRALAAIVVDHEGIVRTAKSGELRFSGLRRVENLAPYSQDLTNAFWVKQTAGYGSLPVVTPDAGFAIDGSKHADLVVLRLNGGTSATDRSEISANFVTVAGISYLFSLEAYTSDGSTVVVLVDYGGISGKLLTITPTPTRFAANVCTTPGAGYYPVIRLRGGTGTSDFASVYITNLQIENVTGQAVQTPGEYVSNGVLSAPWHGAGVDGVKYFNTTLAGVAFANVPRCLVEPSRINKIRNNTMAGAVAGTPGTDAYYWYRETVAGVTMSVVGAGVENGINYVDLRWAGTATASGGLNFYLETVNGVSAATGQAWSMSLFMRRVAGSTAGINSFNLFMQELTAAPALVTTGTQGISAPTTSPLCQQRYSFNRTTTGGGTVAFIRPLVHQSVTSGASIDITLRIGMPQLEQASVMSSVIPTSGTEVTRPADVLAHPISVGNTGTWVVTLSPGEVPASAGLYPMVSLQVVHAVNQIGLFTQPAGSTLGLTVFTSGVQVVSGTIQSSVVAGGVYRVALSWSASARRITYCINGGTPSAVTGVNMPQALTSFSTAAGNPWIGTVSDSEIFTVEHPPETLKLMSAL